MRRADAGTCPEAPSGKHPWVDVTKAEESNQGLRHFACLACEVQAMETVAGGGEAKWQ